MLTFDLALTRPATKLPSPFSSIDVTAPGLLDHVTVLIGVSVQGRAMAGVIHQPYYNYGAGPGARLGRTIWGVVGIGGL